MHEITFIMDWRVHFEVSALIAYLERTFKREKSITNSKNKKNNK